MTSRIAPALLVVATVTLTAVAVAQVASPAKRSPNRAGQARRDIAKRPPQQVHVKGAVRGQVVDAQREHFGRVPPYSGLTVAPAHNLPRDQRRVQERLGTLLSKRDFVPQQRLQHFAWCDAPDKAITGWYGQVIQVEDVPGGVRVKIVVSPRLWVVGGNVPFTADRYIEVYEIVGGNVRFIEGQSPPDAVPGIHMIG